MNETTNLITTITDDFINLEVISLFERLLNNKSLRLFAITSDIDNLGIIISRYGRAFGQNIVDYSTNVLIRFLNSGNSTINKENLVFIPAGEEVTILGVDSSEDNIRNFFNDLSLKINAQTKLFESEKIELSITFGYGIISDQKILQKIYDLISVIRNNEKQLTTKSYFKLMYDIRTQVSLSVDEEKFKDLLLSDSKQIIFVRNVVYLETLDYKSRTSGVLKTLKAKLDSISNTGNLFSRYGLNPDDQVEMKLLLEQPSNQAK